MDSIDVKNSAESKCSLYLAETVDDAGRLTMGVFTTAYIPAGTVVGQPDLSIPLIDIPIHNSPSHEDDEEFWWMWNDLVWNSLDVGGATEAVDVKSAVPGLASLIRGNTELYNVEPLTSVHNSAGLHRGRDPGAGSISYHYGTPTVTTRAIKAGQELHFNFGYHWHLEREDSKHRLEHHPSEYPEIKRFFEKYQSIEDKFVADVSDDFRSKLWAVLDNVPLHDNLKKILPSWGNAQNIAHHVLNNHQSSTDWIEENGICMDNIVPGQSTMPEAGRGAFASRLIQEGSVIAPAPVIHVTDKTILNMYQPVLNPKGGYHLSDKVAGKQLLLNYCFGHEATSKLLCPIGSGTSYINHSNKPNAAIRWTKSTKSFHKTEWLNMTVAELGEQIDIGLMMEYYALSEIRPGHEIFINYGDEWERAWNEHVQNWQPLPESKGYIPASTFNERQETVIRTEEEQGDEPYAANIETSCYYEYWEDGDDELGSQGFVGGDEKTVVKPWHGVGEEDALPRQLRPCRILSRTEVGADGTGTPVYKAQILNLEHMEDEQLVPRNVRLVLTDVPRRAIAFTDRPYSTDVHLANAFRHEMQLQEEMLPAAWRNLEK